VTTEDKTNDECHQTCPLVTDGAPLLTQP